MTVSDALFDVEELAVPARAGRAEAGLGAALKAAADAELILDVDAGLVAAALIAARALDRAEAMPDKSAVYAVAQLLPPYQKALHALRLPAEAAPVAGRVPAGPATEGAGGPSWLGDTFGPRASGHG
jgi:hypothetical protein